MEVLQNFKNLFFDVWNKGISGINSGSDTNTSCNNQKMMDPKDLLPKDYFDCEKDKRF